MCVCLEVKCKQRGVFPGEPYLIFVAAFKINCRSVLYKAIIALTIKVESFIKCSLARGDRCAVEHEYKVIQDGVEIGDDH